MLNRSEFVILSIDDSRDDRDILRRILEHKGYTFMQAGSIEESKKVISERIPHLILLDIDMGEDENGFDFLTYIKNEQAYKDIPVIMVSNHASSDLVAEALSRGSSDYIIKPVNSVMLNERVDKFLSPLMKTRGDSYNISIDSEEAKCVLRFQTHISKISEYGVYVASNIYYRGAQNSTLTSDILEDINMNTMPKRIIKTSVVDDKTRHRFPSLKYETYLSYVGIGEEDCRNIRKYITNNLTSYSKKVR